VHVAQLDPQFVFVVQIHRFVVYLHRAFCVNPILDIDYIGLVEEIVGYWRNQVKGSVKDEETAPRLLYSRLICPSVELYEELMQDCGKHSTELGLFLVLDVWVLHVDGAHREQALRQLVDQGHQHLVANYCR